MDRQLAGKLALLEAGRFNVGHYLDQCVHAGIRNFLAHESLLDHYVREGWRLGLNPSGDFSVASCLAANPDIRAAGIEPLGMLLLRPEPPHGGTQAATEPGVAEGAVDYLSVTRAIGWAWLPMDPAEAVEIEVSLDGTVIAQATASVHRPDLQGSGRGSGQYGFDVEFAPVEHPGRLLVEAVQGALRTGLPVSNLDETPWQWGPVTAAQPQPDQVTSGVAELGIAGAFRIRGSVDEITPIGASGWVYAPDHPAAELQVEVLVDSRMIGRTLANDLRQDLLDHGVGTGYHGFRVRFTEFLPEGGQLAFRVLMLTDGMLECDVGVTPAETRDFRDASHSTAANLVAEHDRFTSRGPDFEEHDPSIIADLPASTALPLLMAFYLPQFHAILENDHFWGKGFTEWRQLARALSRFPGHYQPRIPRDLGFYNLTNAVHMRSQVDLAMSSGIGAFAFYYYWFNGRRVLEQPLDLFADTGFDLKFTLIWANENWTRTWDGSESQVLLKQDYLLEDEPKLLENWAGYFKQKNYLQVGGRPLFFIYNPGAIPETRKTILRWRATLSVRYGIDPLLFMCQTFGQLDPHDLGFDGAMEFPPHKIASLTPARPTPDAYSPEFSGNVVPYDDFAAASRNEEHPDYPLIKTALPGWDNDPRRPNRGFTLEGIAPAKYEAWLSDLLDRAGKHKVFDLTVVAINAWNEWAECAYLEPDVYYGAAFLNATARALRSACTNQTGTGSDVPKVSVIVPNYNHERFLPERLGSLLRQTIPPDEIIFLDDCSTDDSLSVARDILKDSGIEFQIIPNTVNSGGVFRQWIKGMQIARNTLIWIAESDDSADERFLERLLPAFERQDVMAAFGRIQCIDETGALRKDLDGYFDELEHFDWNKPSVVPAYTAFQRDFVLRNVIPNASGAVFRKPILTAAEIERLYEYRFAGDWYFYALVLRGGAIAYRHRATSMFRIGTSSASRSKFSTEQHRHEHAMILEDLQALYAPGEQALLDHIALLSKHFPNIPRETLIETTMPRGRKDSRLTFRVCVAAHGFSTGGGELLPVELANALKERGHHVTYFVIEMPAKDTPNSLRPRLRHDIPVVTWDNVVPDVPKFLDSYGIEVLNSHNVSVESYFAYDKQAIAIPYVASLHGGYEHAPDHVTPALLEYVGKTVDLWLYLGEKNYTMLGQSGIEPAKFRRSFNASSAEEGDGETRESIRARYGLEPGTVALVICSRAIYDKGWQVAIDATKQLVKSGLPLHLMLIGDGKDLPALQAANEQLPFVSFLGYVDRPKRLFSGFDLGIFPSTYVGETFPLFLLECFQAGLPVVATDVGEIGYMMDGAGSQRPGVLVSAQGKPAALVRRVAKAVGDLVRSPEAMARARDGAKLASDRFSMDRLVEFYEDSFRELVT